MRHDLAWVSQYALPHVKYIGPAPLSSSQAVDVLKEWLADRLPLVVARQIDEFDQPLSREWVRLGLAEPLSRGKRRLAFLVPRSQLLRVEQGPHISLACAQLPRTWQPALLAMLQGFNDLNVQAHLFGSAAIQVATGLECVHEGSDLDVLLTPSTWRNTDALCSFLDSLRKQHPAFKVDGEIRSPDGVDVHWQELHQGRQQILAKTSTRVSILDVKEFRARFADCDQGAA